MINQICSFPFNFHFISAFGCGIGIGFSASLSVCAISSVASSPHPLHQPLPVPDEAQSSFKNIRNFDLCSLWFRVGFQFWLFGFGFAADSTACGASEGMLGEGGTVGLSCVNFPLWL